jgi:hypothetical protein
MGAWGAGCFENDTALDWVWELADSDDLILIESAVAEVLDATDYLDADVACIGLAAVEAVAALAGNPAEDLPEQVAGWVEAQSAAPPEALVQDCLAAVDKIRRDKISELKELWEEDAAVVAEWHAVLDDLVMRLQ